MEVAYYRSARLGAKRIPADQSTARDKDAGAGAAVTGARLNQSRYYDLSLTMLVQLRSSSFRDNRHCLIQPHEARDGGGVGVRINAR